MGLKENKLTREGIYDSCCRYVTDYKVVRSKTAIRIIRRCRDQLKQLNVSLKLIAGLRIAAYLRMYSVLAWPSCVPGRIAYKGVSALLRARHMRYHR